MTALRWRSCLGHSRHYLGIKYSSLRLSTSQSDLYACQDRGVDALTCQPLIPASRGCSNHCRISGSRAPNPRRSALREPCSPSWMTIQHSVAGEEISHSSTHPTSPSCILCASPSLQRQPFSSLRAYSVSSAQLNPPTPSSILHHHHPRAFPYIKPSSLAGSMCSLFSISSTVPFFFSNRGFTTTT
ncbi:uncharacterized protein BO66DRAFT_77209 [Aspergillus aculeatinus CBS 121060]|uniref:Uncharacterized protein n=1 Tax=Aspergillus aculeatinus CBS 121060 TaxID=1448322 RepID=A0ACD1HAQ3_9EURO|nr:hypothetical protein BO66DRAFT_77209 [Aspergillus aculeatinus CBS 121060]RAH70632.1 hypothetical protein BO66DRAFT_77209 [Aspergillus aculeatinus CBS 121060]